MIDRAIQHLKRHPRIYISSIFAAIFIADTLFIEITWQSVIILCAAAFPWLVEYIPVIEIPNLGSLDTRKMHQKFTNDVELDPNIDSTIDKEYPKIDKKFSIIAHLRKEIEVKSLKLNPYPNPEKRTIAREAIRSLREVHAISNISYENFVTFHNVASSVIHGKLVSEETIDTAISLGFTIIKELEKYEESLR